MQNIPHYFAVGFFYLIKPVWQVTAYLEITFWWKILVSPLCSSPLTYRSTSNSYLNVGIKLFLFCKRVKTKLAHCERYFAKEAIGWLACEWQTYFRASLLSLQKLIFGGREATTGNMSAVCRLLDVIIRCHYHRNWLNCISYLHFYMWNSKRIVEQNN